MSEHTYSAERGMLILLSLMKAHGVRKVIASPGSTNISFVISVQHDDFFEVYSAPDERSAAYMACGLAAESGEPVALSCTGATASRNYVPGLTEAYYRKLPVLAITATQHMGQIGQYVPQMIDRTTEMNDLVNLSIQIPIMHDEMDAWAANISINNALLELRHNGGGPVHINFTTSYPFYPNDFSVRELPNSHVIRRYVMGDELPSLDGKRVAVFVGSHVPWDEGLTTAVDAFCGRYDAVVLCDQTSNYHGKYAFSAALSGSQDLYDSPCMHMDALVHIGEVSGAYLNVAPTEVWRVNPDGAVRDTFRKLSAVFQMSELSFFQAYAEGHADSVEPTEGYLTQCKQERAQLLSHVPELPLSNAWCAQVTYDKLPSGSYLYLGILNSLRAWNFCDVRSDLTGFSNTGGFGIDGGTSSALGGSLAHPGSLHYLVTGDLAFFYDMNAIGNRHVMENLRILLINNGKGTEFRNYTNFASEFGDAADAYIAAGGHYGKQSPDLVRHYCEDLGFDYRSASSKEEYLESLDWFTDPEMSGNPLLFEVFTTNQQEDEALWAMRHLLESKGKVAKEKIKHALGPKGVSALKKLTGR